MTLVDEINLLQALLYRRRYDDAGRNVFFFFCKSISDIKIELCYNKSWRFQRAEEGIPKIWCISFHSFVVVLTYPFTSLTYLFLCQACGLRWCCCFNVIKQVGAGRYTRLDCVVVLYQRHSFLPIPYLVVWELSRNTNLHAMNDELFDHNQQGTKKETSLNTWAQSCSATIPRNLVPS